MRNLLISIFLFTFAMPVMAQSDKPRNWSQITTMKVNGKYDKTQARIFTQKGLPHWKEISLKNYDSTHLNKIELALLDKYSDVVITRILKVYFTFNNDSIGISSITGEELVPPIAGKIRWSIGNTYFVGDLTSDFDSLTEYVDKQHTNSTYKVAYPCGLFKCVLKASPKGMQIVIPYGKYDFISAAPKNLGIRGLYVCKIDDEGNALWGLCDKKGNEIIACEYKSIYFNGKSFIGDNDYSMEEIQSFYEEKVQLKQNLAQQHRQQWAAALNTFGQAALTIGQAMQRTGSSSDVGKNNSANSGYDNASSHSNSQGGNHPGMSRSQLQSRYNAAIENIQRIKDSWSMHVGTHSEVVQRDNLRSVKKNIQSIKSSAQKHGVSLQLSPLENWNP